MHRQIFKHFPQKNKSGDSRRSPRDSVCIDEAPGEIWEDWESFTKCDEQSEPGVVGFFSLQTTLSYLFSPVFFLPL